MVHITRDEFNRTMLSGEDLILFCYRKNDAKSYLGLETIKEIDHMVGQNFLIYLIDCDAQPEIVNALGIVDVPEYITIKQSKIYKRSVELLTASMVLNLLK